MESSAKITHNQPKSPKKTESPRDFAGEESRELHAVADQLWDAWTKRPQKTMFSVWFGGFPYFFSESNARRMCIYIYMYIYIYIIMCIYMYIYTIVDLTITKEDVMWIGQPTRVVFLWVKAAEGTKEPQVLLLAWGYSISMAIIGHDGNPPFHDSSLRSSSQLLLDCKSPYFTVVADSITSVLVLPLPVAKSRSFWLLCLVKFLLGSRPTARPISTARGTSTAVMTTAQQRPRFSRQVPTVEILWGCHGDIPSGYD